MIRRRDLLYLAAAGVCATCSPAFGQWPQDNSSGELAPRSPPRLQGCMIGTLADMRIVWLGEREEEKFVDETFELALTLLDAEGLVAVFDGPDSYNALASPEPLIIQSRRADEGSVFIGRQLIRNEQSRRRSDWRSSLAMVIAHEASHLLQYETGLKLAVRPMELHADFLAGWVMGRFRRDGQSKLSGLEAAEQALREMTTTRFGDPDFHGSAQERIGALRAGFARSARRDVPFDEGLNYLRIG